MKHIQIILFYLLLLVSSCSNDDVTAPPITAENTFSCKIDGNLFVPEDHGGFPATQLGIRALVVEENTWRFILSNSSTDLYIYLVNVTSTGSYQLFQSDGDADFFQETRNLVEADLDQINGSTHISTEQSGAIEVLELEVDKQIILQFDEIILSGRDNSSETVSLTEGRLNINLETLFEEN